MVWGVAPSKQSNELASLVLVSNLGSESEILSSGDDEVSGNMCVIMLVAKCCWLKLFDVGINRKERKKRKNKNERKRKRKYKGSDVCNTACHVM